MKPIRTAISGAAAIPLLNWGKQWLRMVEAMPDAFPGNPELSDLFRNQLANRTIVGTDGSILRTQRGPINFAEAFVPQPEITVAQIEEFLEFGLLLIVFAGRESTIGPTWDVWALTPAGFKVVSEAPFTTPVVDGFGYSVFAGYAGSSTAPKISALSLTVALSSGGGGM